MRQYIRHGKRTDRKVRPPFKRQTHNPNLFRNSLILFLERFSPKFGDKAADALGFFLIGLVAIALYMLAPSNLVQDIAYSFFADLLKSYLKI